jgi:hypothetical protein
MSTITKEELKELLQNNLSVYISASTDSDSGDDYLKIEVSISFDGDQICTSEDFISTKKL